MVLQKAVAYALRNQKYNPQCTKKNMRGDLTYIFQQLSELGYRLSRRRNQKALISVDSSS